MDDSRLNWCTHAYWKFHDDTYYFSKAVVRYGVTTVIADAHEMANVFGLEGLKAFMAAETELDIFHAIPSSVPSTTPELETTGGIIGLAEVAELLKEPKVICLGKPWILKGFPMSQIL